MLPHGLISAAAATRARRIQALRALEAKRRARTRAGGPSNTPITDSYAAR
jgi:hypothetical protein